MEREGVVYREKPRIYLYYAGRVARTDRSSDIAVNAHRHPLVQGHFRLKTE